jgi:dihydrofolate reductase
MSSGGAAGRNDEGNPKEYEMGKVVVSQFITVDGVVEDPGGSENLDRGGWAFEFDRGDEGDAFKMDELAKSDALLLGRTTYEGFAAAWPSRSGDPFSEKFNSMPKYVVSSTLEDPEWNNSTVLTGDLSAAVTELREKFDGDILVNGSVQLARELGELGLVDEYRLMVFPTVLGGGKRLFGETAATEPLRLTESRPAGETLILIYEPAAKSD